MSTTIHTSISVRGVLHWKDRELKGMFRDQDGRKLIGSECREHLLDCLQQGILQLPMGSPCDGFSHQTGCPGHKDIELMGGDAICDAK